MTDLVTSWPYEPVQRFSGCGCKTTGHEPGCLSVARRSNTGGGITVEDKLISEGVQHHEIKFHESRFGSKGHESARVQMSYYCVCGGWGGSVDHFRKAEVVDVFMAEHLGVPV